MWAMAHAYLAQSNVVCDLTLPVMLVRIIERDGLTLLRCGLINQDMEVASSSDEPIRCNPNQYFSNQFNILA